MAASWVRVLILVIDPPPIRDEGSNQVSVTGRNGEPATEIMAGARRRLADDGGAPVE